MVSLLINMYRKDGELDNKSPYIGIQTFMLRKNISQMPLHMESIRIKAWWNDCKRIQIEIIKHQSIHNIE
jgi:hypothetical protein